MSGSLFTAREAKEKVRDPQYLAKLKRRMKDDPIGRANVNPEIVSALIDELEAARESNTHNLAVAKAATDEIERLKREGHCGAALYVE